MDVRILAEEHNAVRWEMRSLIAEVELGIFGGATLIVIVLLFAQNPLRWYYAVGVTVLASVAALYVALTTPLIERGAMERTPEGGSVSHEIRWLLRRQPVKWETSLDAISSVGVAYRRVEETDGETSSAARFCVRLKDGEGVLPLTGWASVTSAERLQEAFAKAARLPLVMPLAP